jgi:hypothetical protein
VLNAAHDSHLHVHFLVENSILHKASLFEFLCSKWGTIKFGSDFVNDGKGALANLTDLVVFVATLPFSYMLAKCRHGREVRGINSRSREEIYLSPGQLSQKVLKTVYFLPDYHSVQFARQLLLEPGLSMHPCA